MVAPNDEHQILKLLAKYKHASQTKKDVIDVLDSYQGLHYKREPFVFNDGAKRELLNLSGTIPVNYKGNTYHIPICIWIMDTHPQNAPLCYVRPTPDMQIKVSMYVDHNGKVYLPYLHDWQPTNSDLLSLIQIMIVTFGDFPPVYSKPKETPYPSSTSFMPQPGGPINSYLPYPPSGGNFPQPYNMGGSSTGYGGAGGGGGYPPYPPAANSATPAGGPGYPPYSNMSGGYPPAPGGGYNTNYQNTTNQTGTITEEHIKASLISAVEDKLRRRMQEKVNQCQAEIQTLKRTKHELTEGRSKINEITAQLEREEGELKRNIAVLEDKEQELVKSLESLEKSNGIDVDEAVITTAPLYRQLLNAYAEEAATEDVIYYLGEALRGGVIDLEVFLKHIRQLSRKQFMLRAIMQKCRQKAGLAG